MNNYIQDVRAKYESGAPSEAKELIVKALEDASAEELVSLGALAKEYSDYASANNTYAQLVKTAPENPDYLNYYAMALIQSGDFEQADTHLREALSINDAHAHSYFNLSMIHQATTGDAMISKIENLLQSPDITPSESYAFRLALGKFYDDAGDYDNAFAQFQTAKQSAPVKYDHGAQQAFFKRLKTAFTKDLFEKNSKGGDPSPSPIFIIGMPRSGSSLLETMLAQDGRISALGERIEMTLILQQLTKRMDAKKGYLELLPNMTADEFRQCGAGYCRRLAPLSNGAERVTDKNVLNFLRAGFINLILPNSTMLHIRRDPIDTCLSCYFQTFDPAVFPFTFDLADIGKYYALYADLMSYWNSVMPDRIIDVDYEQLINTPDNTIETLLTKIGSPPEKQSSANEPKKTMVATTSAWQARQPVYETSVNRWKNYEKHLAPLFAALEQSGFNDSVE